MRLRDLKRDLRSRVARPHDKHTSRPQLCWIGIVPRAQLLDLGRQISREGRDARRLIGTRRDDHLIGFDLLSGRNETVMAVYDVECGDSHTRTDMKRPCAIAGGLSRQTCAAGIA